MTRDALTNELPAVTVALCIGCNRQTSAPVPIRWIESVSGPGTTLYGCPDCVPKLAPGPLPGELPEPLSRPNYDRPMSYDSSGEYDRDADFRRRVDDAISALDKLGQPYDAEDVAEYVEDEAPATLHPTAQDGSPRAEYVRRRAAEVLGWRERTKN